MGRTTTFLVGFGLLTLTLTACNGSADPPPTSPTPTAASTSSTPTPPTPPAMPEAAKAHTKAGAKAFVEYFWKVVDFAGATLDVASLEALTADGCHGCEGAVQFVRDMKEGRAQFNGASTQVANFRVANLTLSGQLRMELTFDVTTPDQRVDYPGSDRDEHYPAGTTRARFLLKPVQDGWRVVLWESA